MDNILQNLVNKLFRTSLTLLFVCMFISSALAASEEQKLRHYDWSFDGIFGTFDRGALQRGYKVYNEVCSSCHSMSLLYFRNLSQKGGPEFTKAEVKAIAAEKTVIDGPNEDGEMFERPGEPRDRFISPYANDKAARVVNNGALPPDLSIIVKARKHGADYIYSLLRGYGKAPDDVEVLDGLYYNDAYSGGLIAMTAPLFDGLVSYDDGTSETVAQYASDVSHFLAWASEPTLEHRKSIGFKVIIFLIILSLLLYYSNRKIWKRIKNKDNGGNKDNI